MFRKAAFAFVMVLFAGAAFAGNDQGNGVASADAERAMPSAATTAADRLVPLRLP